MTTEAQEPAAQSVTHTYPDGSARIGVPPFPATSPLEDEAAARADESAPQAPQNTLTASDLEGAKKTRKSDKA